MKNLIVRCVTGVAFVAIIVGGILYGPLTYCLLFALITGLSVWEFCSLMNDNADCQINRVITTVASVYFFFSVFAFNANFIGSEVFIPYMLTLIYLMIAELYFKENNTLMNWAYTLMSQLYIALPFAVLNTLTFFAVSYGYGEQGVVYNPAFTLAIFIFIWSSDSGAYGFGCWLGKHRLFPRISPKKSWEGVFGGAFVALVASQIVATYSNAFYADNDLSNRLAWGGLALVVVIFGTWGDLIESLLKRKLGIKDSGNILPGHGGILDRFDSSLIAIPAAVIYVYMLNSSYITSMIDKMTALF